LSKTFAFFEFGYVVTFMFHSKVKKFICGLNLLECLNYTAMWQRGLRARARAMEVMVFDRK
jgi:hypothetical protein